MSDGQSRRTSTLDEMRSLMISCLSSSDLAEELAPKVSRNGSAPVVVEHAHPDAVRGAGPVYAAPEQHGSGTSVVGSHFTNDVVHAVEKLHPVLHRSPHRVKELLDSAPGYPDEHPDPTSRSTGSRLRTPLRSTRRPNCVRHSRAVDVGFKAWVDLPRPDAMVGEVESEL